MKPRNFVCTETILIRQAHHVRTFAGDDANPTPNSIHPLFSGQVNPTVSINNRSGFRVHVKSDPLIREFCDLPRRYHVTVGGKKRVNNKNNQPQTHTDNLFERKIPSVYFCVGLWLI